MYNEFEPKELKAMYKALIEINDIGKNLRVGRTDYVLINGMLITWRDGRQDNEFFGHTIAFLSESIMKDLGPIADIPLYINGSALGTEHTTHKISNFHNIEFYDGYIDVVWYDTVDIDDKEILNAFIDKHNNENMDSIIVNLEKYIIDNHWLSMYTRLEKHCHMSINIVSI